MSPELWILASLIMSIVSIVTLTVLAIANPESTKKAMYWLGMLFYVTTLVSWVTSASMPIEVNIVGLSVMRYVVIGVATIWSLMTPFTFAEAVFHNFNKVVDSEKDT